MDLKTKIESLPQQTGCYIMKDKNDQVIYVGKAKNIQKRVRQYLKPLNNRLQMLLQNIYNIDYILTNDETGALLLEANLIKSHKPKYNILLQDDKSFPYIAIDLSHPFPRFNLHLGRKTNNKKYFGPFPAKAAVYSVLENLAKIFKIRSCKDVEFKQRTRPCLEYEINRCSAPCVGKIATFDYLTSINAALDFLSGKSQNILLQLQTAMQAAVKNENFEKAALIRDQIKNIKNLKSSPEINQKKEANLDIIFHKFAQNFLFIIVLFYRNGQNTGQRFFMATEEIETATIFSQIYQELKCPNLIWTNFIVENLVEKALNTKILPIKEKIIADFAVNNLNMFIEQFSKEKNVPFEIWQELQDLMQITELNKIEIYDNSHWQGKSPFGCYVVASSQGWVKKEYRKIKLPEGTDNDYEALEKVLTKRLNKTNLPELIIVDGGQGHLNILNKLASKYNFSGQTAAISKGPDRKTDVLHLGSENIKLDDRNHLHRYLKSLRDEAHRFAIMQHRYNMLKNMTAGT